MWLEVTALDQTGKSTLVGKHVFGTVLKDAAGKYPVELWEAVAFQSDDRIPPKESVTDRFEFTMPSDGEVELKATLYYRSCTEDMAAKAGVEIPTTIMAETVQASYSSEQARAEANRVEPGQGGDQGGVGSLIWALAGMALGGGAVAFFILRGRRAN